MNEQSKISTLKGVGAKTEELFAKIGIHTIGELLRYYPRGYDIYEDPVTVSEAEEGKIVTVTGAIYGKVTVGGSRNMQITTMYVKDLTGTLKVIWFRMPFLRNTLGRGGVITLRGQVSDRKGTLVMEHPEIFYPSAQYEEKRNTMQPLYPLTSGLTNNAVLKAVKQAVLHLDLMQEFLPDEIRREYHLAEYNYAVRQIHFPDDKESFCYARERLVFEEFLIFILALRQMKESETKSANEYHLKHLNEIDDFIAKLPYELTNAQKKVWSQIEEDIAGEHMMSRLVQGDVGSGKTIIAVLSLMSAGLNGYQGALMAPTEVLARQHYQAVVKMLEQYEIPLECILLTGSMTAKEKRTAYEKIESGEVQIVIGTHALIQEKVNYKNLALVVTA